MENISTICFFLYAAEDISIRCDYAASRFLGLNFHIILFVTTGSHPLDCLLYAHCSLTYLLCFEQERNATKLLWFKVASCLLLSHSHLDFLLSHKSSAQLLSSAYKIGVVSIGSFMLFESPVFLCLFVELNLIVWSLQFLSNFNYQLLKQLSGIFLLRQDYLLLFGCIPAVYELFILDLVV